MIWFNSKKQKYYSVSANWIGHKAKRLVVITTAECSRMILMMVSETREIRTERRSDHLLY